MVEEKIQSIERVFKILEAFKHFSDGAGLTELSEYVDLHKSTVHRFLSTLIVLGYVKKDENNKYNLTLKLYTLARHKTTDLDLITICHKHLKEFSKTINEVIHLVMQDDIYAVYIDKIDSTNAITLQSKVGRRALLVSTSVGKAMLSNCSYDEIREIWDRSSQVKTTENRITDFNVFCKELEKIRQTRIAVDNEENELGVYCVGTAIYGATGEVKGAISITGPTFRMKEKINDELYAKLLHTADIISKELGYAIDS
ncbi:IclR family transcriptional regulator [Treponema phagedenis]|uniref:IclR family transcriptional regulator n=1 Tax=Treponema phagedenis TaxID=162 RepID=A0A0B7GR57_TREPH|nr:IclR family transcriptional regulator [Treponema phagedenis]NVP25465.1 IclR family transcriptional regulator [Treponema phagedenis]QEJ93941.1 IclR family transcriptional regulator [Treponema phagedenis]QEJ96736.1 IclR family transcriptional regulator [Treponema phagedenis]QEJ96807.1 IclR family transcriptional regulator [Treponema phagedenis]QEJ96896.1 IclR family transcriptional regulator [Treponema phagedenis]